MGAENDMFDDELKLEQFVLNDEKNRNNQVIFHEVLRILIDKYNTLSEEKRRAEGIFYLKHSKILLGNITEEVVQSFYNYKELFDGLVSGKARFFREYEPKLDNDSYKAFSDNHGYNIRYGYYKNDKNNRNNYALSDNFSECDQKHDYFTCKKKQFKYNEYNEHNETRQNKQKKIIYNLNHFSLYFNGMYFEKISVEVFFKLIKEKIDTTDSNKKYISFLPRIIFFNKNSVEAKQYYGNKSQIDFYGYSEIDCVFVLNEKEQVTIEKVKIACFGDFDTKDEIRFFNEKNFVNIIIEKDNVVFLEVKSSFESVIDKNSNKNILKKFINKASKFVSYYEELNLIKKNQKIVLIFLYNNSMYYDIRTENFRIKDAYELIKGNKRVKLYIAYFQPYLKMINSYQHLNEINELNNKVKNQQEKLDDQQKQINNLMDRIKILEQNQKNNDTKENNEK